MVTEPAGDVTVAGKVDSCMDLAYHQRLVSDFHSYSKGPNVTPQEQKVAKLQQQNAQLKTKLNRAEQDAKQQSKTSKILRENDERTRQFTGFPTYKCFVQVFEKRIKPKAKLLATNCKKGRTDWTKTSHSQKPGKKRKLELIDEFLLVMMRIHLGSVIEDLAERFGVERSQVSRIIICWIPLIARRLKTFIKFASKDQIKRHMPSSFKKYGNTRTIIDCTEIFIQRPSSLKPRQQTYSSYKHHNTAKILVGITPEGGVSFLSKAWGGRVSDKHIVNHSGLLDLLEPHDSVMADRGFVIAAVLAQRCCTLNLPPFTKGKVQLSRPEVEKHRRISRLRIHVERTISRLKSFRILKGVYPINQLYLLNDILTISAAIVNLWPPIVRK